jgi:hypothetical protein
MRVQRHLLNERLLIFLLNLFPSGVSASDSAPNVYALSFSLFPDTLFPG